MAFKIILSGKNSHQLITDDGFRYALNRKPQGPNLTAYYECVVRGCPARAATTGNFDDNIQLKYHNSPNKPHNHNPDLESNKAQETLSEFRSAAHQNPEHAAKATYEEILSTKGEEGAVPSAEFLQKLGPFSKHQNMFYRIRKKHRPNLPKTIDEVDIDSFGDLAKCLDGGDFYRCMTSSKSAVFISPQQVIMAGNSTSVFIDATYGICPHPFKQVLVLRGKVEGTVHTLA